jgi:predicted ATPase
LCQQIGETPQLFSVLYGLWLYYEVRAELRTAHELGEQCLKLAQSAQDSALLLEAHFALGLTLFWLGELALAREHFEQGMALYDLQQHLSLASIYGSFDPGVACLACMAWTLWFLGYPDQALKRVHEALNLAQELAHPLSVALALQFAAGLHQYRRES